MAQPSFPLGLICISLVLLLPTTAASPDKHLISSHSRDAPNSASRRLLSARRLSRLREAAPLSSNAKKAAIKKCSLNTCGLGKCNELKTGKYSCTCPQGFEKAVAGDGSPTCGLIDPTQYWVVYKAVKGDTCQSVGKQYRWKRWTTTRIHSPDYSYDSRGPENMWNQHVNCKNIKNPIRVGTLIAMPLPSNIPNWEPLPCGIASCVVVQPKQTCVDVCKAMRQPKNCEFMKITAEDVYTYMKQADYDWDGIDYGEASAPPPVTDNEPDGDRVEYSPDMIACHKKNNKVLAQGSLMCRSEEGCATYGCTAPYKVKKGETCKGLLQTFRQSAMKFKKLNGVLCLDKDLFPGKAICTNSLP